jgi:hypothetical protein
MDMAMTIMNHSDATILQKTGAFAYATALTFGHLSLAAGTALGTYALSLPASIGAGLGAAANSTLQTIGNYQEGMSLGQAIYNINGAQVLASGVAGGFTGVVGGAALPFVATETSLLFGAGSIGGYGAAILSSAGYGAAINVTGGRIGEIILNLLNGCEPLRIESSEEYQKLAFVRALTAGAATLVDQIARSTTIAASQAVRNNVHNEAWDATWSVAQEADVAISPSSHWLWNGIDREITRRTLLLLDKYYAASTAISIVFNSDVWKLYLDSEELAEN